MTQYSAPSSHEREGRRARETDVSTGKDSPQAEVRGEKMARVVQAVYSVHLELGAFLVCLNHALSTEQDEGLEGQLSG